MDRLIIDHLNDLLKKFYDRKVVVVGDVMLDQYLSGPAHRVSQEAPVPIVSIEKEEYELGGAANVASNIVSLGGTVSLFGAIGNDDDGKIVSRLLQERGVHFFPSPEYAPRTTKKVRIISQGQQIGRHDYDDTSPKKAHYPHLEREVRNADIIVVSDYAKGVIGKELVDLVKSYDKRVIVDPKPKNMSLYKGVYLVKSNKKEALKAVQCEDIYQAGINLRDIILSGSRVIITCGPEGMTLFDTEITDMPTTARGLSDPTGAGDTVIATLAMALAAGSDLKSAATLANYAAGIAVETHRNASVTRYQLEGRIAY